MSFHPHQQKALVTLLIYVAIAAGVGSFFDLSNNGSGNSFKIFGETCSTYTTGC